MRRKTKLFSLILSLILVMVSVPISVYSKEIDKIENFEQVTEAQEDLELVTSVDNFIEFEEEPLAVDSTSSNSMLVTGIPDGIYAIETASLSSYYISYSQSSSYASCNSVAVSPTLMGNTTYLFTVTKVADTDRYIIRSVSDQTRTLCVSGDYVVWGNISEDDGQVSESNTFNIIYANGTYRIKNVGTGKYICGNTGYLIASDSPETQVLPNWRFRGYRSYIEDGVYAFENLGNSGLWMDTQYDSYNSGRKAQQYAYANCPAEDFSRGGLFKLDRIGNTDQYIIRLMTNNLLAWGIDGSSVISYDLPQNEDDIPDNMKFHIAYDNGSYFIIPYSSNMSAVSATPNSTASGNEGRPDSYLNSVSRLTATNSAKWVMYKYVGPDRCGADIIVPDEIESIGAIVGKTYTISHTVWYTRENVFEFSMSAIDSTFEDIYLDYDSDSCSATMVFSNPGHIDFYVFADCTMNDGDPNREIAAEGLFYAIPQEGIYYLQNRHSNLYANIANSSMNDGAIVHQLKFSIESNFQWEVEHVEDSGGYVRLKSVLSGKYMGADISNPNQIAIRQYSTTGDNTLWRFETLDDGSLRIACKATESSEVVLSVPNQLPGLGEGLTQYTYIDDQNRSNEWYLYRLSGYTVNVSVIYDNAYSNRYSNAYSRINNQILVLQEKYMQEFGIIVNDISLTSFFSYADIYCTTDHTVECNHDTETCRNSKLVDNGYTELYSLHHTNIYNIMLRIPFPDLSYTVKVAYIGHEICTETNHTKLQYYGLSYKSIALATIMNFSSEASETKTLIHEFGHFYGVKDHYGGSAKSTQDMIDSTGNIGYSMNCIYGENKESAYVLDDFIICDGCKDTIKNNMSRFDH